MYIHTIANTTFIMKLLKATYIRKNVNLNAGVYVLEGNVKQAQTLPLSSAP